MTKSYIFSSSGFSANAHGRIFHKGKRKFSFVCSSAKVIAQIEKLEETRAPFPVDELPEKVAALLLHEGLLHEHNENHHRWSSLRIKLSDSTKSMKGQLFRRLSPDVQELFGFFGMQVRGFRTMLGRPRSILLLPRSIVRILMAPIAFVCGPVTIKAAIILETGWLLLNSLDHTDVFHYYSALDGVAKAVVLSLVFLSIVFHELCHAAAGFKRGGATDEIRIGLMACLPYCFTTVPGFHTMTRADRLYVLSAGIVGQLALAIIALMLTPDRSSVHIASEITVIVALFNILPIPGLDGYGILRELRGPASKSSGSF